VIVIVFLCFIEKQFLLRYYPVSDHDHDLRSRLMAKWESYLVAVT